jgi:HEAT repeat protein
MSKSLVERIAAMLGDESLERRMAAAIVLGEVEAKEPAVLDGLAGLLEGGVPPLQRHALDALGKIGAKKVLPKVFPLLVSRDADVRAAAVRAIVGFGDGVIGAVQDRMEEADPAEKRALEEVLARLGGKEALAALLDGLDTEDAEASRTAALAIRRRVKEADAKERRGYFPQVERFLERDRTQKSPATVAAALRILGYLEDERTIPVLLKYAAAEKRPDAVREEAIVALRFAPAKGDKRTAERLLDLAEDAPPPCAQAALLTLGSLDPPPSAAVRLRKLALDAEAERARVAVDLLSRMNDEAATEALGDVVLDGKDRARADQAAAALAPREDAGPTLAKAMIDATDAERSLALGRLLRPHVKKLEARTVRALLAEATARLASGAGAFEPLLQIAHDADPKAVAEGLRALAKKLSGKKDRALAVSRLLARSEHATPGDLWELASLELGQGRRDLSPRARSEDPALRLLDTLLGRGFDVAKAIVRDRSLGLEDRYYVGFHFAEKGEPLGEELLSDVAEKAGRTKLGKAARAKLKLAESGSR